MSVIFLFVCPSNQVKLKEIHKKYKNLKTSKYISKENIKYYSNQKFNHHRHPQEQRDHSLQGRRPSSGWPRRRCKDQGRRPTTLSARRDGRLVLGQVCRGKIKVNIETVRLEGKRWPTSEQYKAMVKGLWYCRSSLRAAVHIFPLAGYSSTRDHILFIKVYCSN